MNPDRILLVYQNKKNGNLFKVAWIEDCKAVQATNKWKHTATIDPQVWIEALCNRKTILDTITG